MVSVIRAVEREVAQGRELGLDPVQPGGVRWGVGDFDIVRRRPGADPLTLLCGQVRGEIVTDDGDPHLRWVERAKAAAELEELSALLDRLCVAVELVLGQVQGGKQVPYSAVSVVGRPAPSAWVTVGVLVPAAAVGPLPPGVGDQVERPELVHAEDDFGLALLGYDLAVGDCVKVLDAGLLGRVVGVAGGFPGLQALKRDALLAEQDAQALVADVIDRPLATRKSASSLWITSRTRSALVNDTSAIFATGMPCADSSTIWARRQVTTDPVPLRMIRGSRLPSASSISRTRTRSATHAE